MRNHVFLQRFLSSISAIIALIHFTAFYLFNTLRGYQVVCVALAEHLGDIVAAEPIGRRLKVQASKQTKVVWITGRKYSALPKMFVAVDKVIALNNLGGWIVLKRLLPAVRVYDLHLNNRLCVHTGWRLKNPTANPGVDDKNYYHFVNLLGLECTNAGIELFDDHPQLFPSGRSGFFEEFRLLSKYAVVHARANEEDRQWDDDKWLELLAIAHRETGLEILEVGLSRPVVRPGTKGLRSLVGQLTLQQLCMVIQHANLYIGVDSGPAHIANAFRVPSVILIGHYRAFRKYVPYSGWLASAGQQGLLHYDGPLRNLPVDTVLQCVREAVGRLTSKSAHSEVRPTPLQARSTPPPDVHANTAGLLEQANIAWKNQDLNRALELYLAAYQQLKTSTQATQSLISFLLVSLFNLLIPSGDIVGKKSVVRAFLLLQPRNDWAIKALFNLACNPYDRLALLQLIEHASSWNLALKQEVAGRIESAHPLPRPAELQTLLEALK